MPSLYRRGKMWYCKINYPGHPEADKSGRLRKPLDESKQKAHIILGDLIRNRQASISGLPDKEISWEAFKEKYLAYSKGDKAHSTHITDIKAIQSLEDFQGLKRLKDLTPELLERFKAHRKGRGRLPGGINRQLGALKAIRSKAIEWGYLIPVPGRVKRVKETLKTPHHFKREEFEKLLKACEGKRNNNKCWYTAAMIGVFAGFRPGEIYWTSNADIDFKHNLIRVTPKYEGNRCVWNPKTFQQRAVPMAPRLAKYLKTVHGSEWILGDRPPYNTLQVYFRKLIKKAGLTGSLKTCRHTFASWLVQAEVPIFTVSKLLGHSSINHTLRYAALCQENFTEAIDNL